MTEIAVVRGIPAAVGYKTYSDLSGPHRARTTNLPRFARDVGFFFDYHSRKYFTSTRAVL